MYQSPVNAIAEMVANAWDADATTVQIELPETVTDTAATFVVRDNGIGMDFEECQRLYLAVGRNRRGKNTQERTAGGRPVLGRKGIGKFAGFGIASLMTVDTVSQATGERTVFRLDLDALTADDEPGKSRKEIEVVDYAPPDDGRKTQHGTSITLSKLTIHRAPSQRHHLRRYRPQRNRLRQKRPNRNRPGKTRRPSAPRNPPRRTRRPSPAFPRGHAPTLSQSCQRACAGRSSG